MRTAEGKLLDSVAVARFIQFDQAFVQENRRSWVCSDLLDGDSRGPAPVYMLVSVISYLYTGSCS